MNLTNKTPSSKTPSGESSGVAGIMSHSFNSIPIKTMFVENTGAV